MVILIRDNECIEPRIKTYENFLLKENIPFITLGWDRKGICSDDEHHIFFKKRAAYGKKIFNIIPKIEWMLFVYKQLKKRKGNIEVIHACDVDAVIPSFRFAKKNKIKIIFDVFDWITSELDNNFVFRYIEKLENKYYEECDYAIICEEERNKQAKTKAKNLLVMPNIPYKDYTPNNDVIAEISSRKQNYRVTLGYVGVFDYNRGIEDLLEVVGSRDDVLLEIAGYGGLNDLVENAAQKHSNIHFWGSVEYDKGQTILSQTDVVVALYYLTNPVHRFAAPNKYYEALKLNKPLLTTKDTLVGDKVVKYSTGYAIAEGVDPISDVLNSVDDRAELEALVENSKNIWEEHYKNYIDNFLENDYKKICV